MTSLYIYIYNLVIHFGHFGLFDLLKYSLIKFRLSNKKEKKILINLLNFDSSIILDFKMIKNIDDIN